VKGIEQLPTGNTKGGRVFIPSDGTVKRGFYISHTIENYKWIFTLEKGKKGYVIQR